MRKAIDTLGARNLRNRERGHEYVPGTVGAGTAHPAAYASPSSHNILEATFSLLLANQEDVLTGHHPPSR